MSTQPEPLTIIIPQVDGSVLVLAYAPPPAVTPQAAGQLDGSDPDQSGWTFGH